MAAIIAHITRANRERIEKKKYEIIISKCMYEIRPFEGCYNPVVSVNLDFNRLLQKQALSPLSPKALALNSHMN